MPRRVVFLTGEFDASDLRKFIASRNPACAVEWVQTAGELNAIAENSDLSEVRLVSFCSGLIVPRPFLDRLGLKGYNIHPGPPSFPGRHPECWGVYHGAERFGATLHVMAPRVDEGEIVDTRWFDVPKGAGQRMVAEAAFKSALELLLAWTDRLVREEAPLPFNGEIWHGRKWRRADLDAICRLPIEIDHAEFERRRRAFAELPTCSLTVAFHGVEFVYTVPPEPSV